MSFSLSFLTVVFTIITVIAFNLNNLNCNAETIFERFRQNSSSIQASSALVNDDQVKFVSGTKVKLLPLQLGGTASLLQPVQPIYNYVRPHYVYFPYFRQNFLTGWPYYHPLPLAPQWQAGAKLTGEGIDGMITFQQLPYNNDIKVTLNAIGLPVGKHALHIHTYGDLNDGCKSTGGQFPNNFLGNIVVKEGGEVNVAFISVYLTLFGYSGIIGRSIVIHEQPIDLNNVLNADIFSTTLHAVHDVQAFQNEENSVGAIIACGLISIIAIPPTEK